MLEAFYNHDFYSVGYATTRFPTSCPIATSPSKFLIISFAEILRMMTWIERRYRSVSNENYTHVLFPYAAYFTFLCVFSCCFSLLFEGNKEETSHRYVCGSIT